MENVVVDSGIAVKWFVDEPYQEKAQEILLARRSGSLRLLAPDLIHAEFGNVIWKKQMFQGLDAADAQAALAAFRAIPLVITPSADLLDEAYQLAVTHRRSVYDMIFLALSLREQCRFVTADERLVNAVGPTFPDLVWLPNWS